MTDFIDPIVQDALDSTTDVNALIDQTLDELPPEPLTPASFELPGGDGTEELLGFINNRGTDISGMVDTVMQGGELTAEQIQAGEHILTTGIDYSPLFTADEIHDSAMNDLEKLTYGFLQTDSSGQTWKWSPETGAWDKVGDSGELIPTLELPPFWRGVDL